MGSFILYMTQENRAHCRQRYWTLRTYCTKLFVFIVPTGRNEILNKLYLRCLPPFATNYSVTLFLRFEGWVSIPGNRILIRDRLVKELDKLIKHENTVNYIKAQRLSWFGHIQRMPEARATKKIFKWNPLTTRPRGRPRYRWEDNIVQDLGQMKIKNWLTCVQVRAKWKDVVEKAKTSN